MKPAKLSYVTEMGAAGTAVAVFIAVYVLGFLQVGFLYTLLFGWLPAGGLAWFSAWMLRSLAQIAFDLQPARGLSSFGMLDDELQPVALRSPRRCSRDATSRSSLDD